MQKQRRIFVAKTLAIFPVIPVLLYAYASGPPPRSTGAQGDTTCAIAGCHAGTVNTGAGRVTINFPGGLTYTPGVKMQVSVTVADPSAVARRWGFQASARPASNERSAQAGHFNAIDNTTQVICEDDSFISGTQTCRASSPVEFIEHTAAGTSPGTPGSKTFNFEWTPPATNVGDVSFFAAGNAANNNGSSDSGDRVYTTKATLTPAAGGGGGGGGGGPKPAVTAGGVVNGGSFRPGIAQNTWVTIRGTNLATATRVWGGTDFVGTKLPTQLNGTAVNINGKPAYVYFISPTQLNVLSPADTATGNVSVEVSLNGVKSDAVTAVAQAVSPAFFIFNNDKYIAATHALGELLGPASLFPGATTPAKPGEVIVLYGTGFGATNPAFPDGQILGTPGTLTGAVTVRIGSLTGDVQFAGLTATGLYQLNVKVPDNAPDGDLAVVATINGIASQTGAFINVQK